jgi:hypothetical protein
MTLKTLVLSCAIALLGAPSARAGLIGLYTFDDSLNTLNDSSGAGNHLTGTAGTDPVWGATTGINSTGAYDYSNDRLIAPIDVNSSVLPQMTWGAWVRTDLITSGTRKVLGQDNGGWDRTIGLDNRNPALFRYTTFVGDDPLNTNGLLDGTPGPTSTTAWAFIAASYNQTSKLTTMYVDLDASTTADALVAVTRPGGFSAGFNTFAIGGIRPDTAAEAWDGAIDQVFVYNEALPPEKLTRIRNRGLLELQGIYNEPHIELTRPTPLYGRLAFETVPAAITRTITIRNTAPSTFLTVNAPVISGTGAASYSIITAPTSLAPGTQGDLQVSFAGAAGTYAASLQITSNDPDSPPIDIPLDAVIIDYVSENLIGLYTFDDSGNTFKDSSGYGNHITGNAGTNPVWGATTGYDGSGAYDYSADRLIVPININAGVLPAMTWGAWVRTDTLTSGLYKVLGHDDGAWDRTIGLDNRNPATFRYTTFTGTANNSGPLEGTPGPTSTTTWSFIAASYDQVAQSTTMYVDVDAASHADAVVAVTELAGFGPGAGTFAIGGISPANNGEAWDGAIDQVFVYNTALTPAQITAIRDRGLRELLNVPPGDPDIALTPANLFGDLTSLGAGPGPVSRVLTILNNGTTQNLTVSGITVTGPDAARYSPPAPPPPIAPGSSADVTVVFTPTAGGGNFFATLNIASNDEDTPVITAGLDAIVTSDPNIEVSAPSPLFGRMTFNTVPAAIQRTITVRNTGITGALTLAAPSITGANASNYSIVSAPASVAPGTEGQIVVALAPGAAGDFAASLGITSNDPDSPAFSFSLNGSVVLVAPATLAAFYSFDDSGDPLRDDSGNGNDITDTAGTDPVWGATTGFNNSGAFDFSSDRLIAPVDINPGTLPQMTWGAWVRTDTLTPNLYKFLGHDDGAWDRTLGLDVRNPGTFRYTTFTGSANNSGPMEGTPGPVNTTDWTFLAATYDETAVLATLYLDLDAATTADPLMSFSELAGFGPGFPTFAIGDIRPDITSEPWDGAIDNVFLFSGILTDDQIKAIRDQGRSAIVPQNNFIVTGWQINPDGTVTLTWNSNPCETYTLRYSFDLSGPVATWADETDDIASGGETTTYTTGISFSSARRVFFSVERN